MCVGVAAEGQVFAVAPMGLSLRTADRFLIFPNFRANREMSDSLKAFNIALFRRIIFTRSAIDRLSRTRQLESYSAGVFSPLFPGSVFAITFRHRWTSASWSAFRNAEETDD
jgi:hypothetical protein